MYLTVVILTSFNILSYNHELKQYYKTDFVAFEPVKSNHFI